jgi:hypothetical protein
MALSLSGTTGIVTGNIADANVTAGKLASGAALANLGASGTVLQYVSSYWDSTYSQSTTALADVPNATISITPKSASSKIMLSMNSWGAATSPYTSTGLNGFIYRSINSGVDTLLPLPADLPTGVHVSFESVQPYGCNQANLMLTDTPNTTSSVVYKLKTTAMQAGYTGYINRSVVGNSTPSRNYRSWFHILEISG